MKSILESYFYLLVITLIVIFSIDLIMINQRVSKINSLARYTESLIEINGEEGFKMAEELVSKNNASISFEYYDSTEDYLYYEYTINYRIIAGSFKINKISSLEGLVRYRAYKK